LCLQIIHWHEDEDTSESQEVRRLPRKRSEPGERQEAIFSTDATQGTVYGLQPNKKNNAIIVVMNGQNDGPSSQIIEFMMPEGGSQIYIVFTQ
jgi:hypothetical protein